MGYSQLGRQLGIHAEPVESTLRFHSVKNYMDVAFALSDIILYSFI